MNNLKDYVNWKLTHADKFAEATGYPLTMENCKKYKLMKELKIYGNSIQDGTPTPDAPIEVQSVGELVTDENDTNYGKYKIPVTTRGVNLFDVNSYPLSVGQVIWGHSGAGGLISGYACTVDYIPCIYLQGKTITINHTLGSNTGIAFYDESYTYISGVRYSGATSKTVTVPNSAMYYRFTVDVNYINEIQIQEGSVVTECESYVEPVTTDIFLNEPLRKLDDYADYIDFKNKKVVHYNDGIVTEEAVNVELPKLTAKTSIIEVDTSLALSDAYGKYIKK